MRALTKLTGRHRRAIALIASGMRYDDVAEDVDVSVGTVNNWMTMPIFRDEVHKLVDELRRTAALTLMTNLTLAVGMLADLAQNGKLERTRLAASKAILDNYDRAASWHGGRQGEADSAEVKALRDALIREEQLMNELRGYDDNEPDEPTGR